MVTNRYNHINVSGGIMKRIAAVTLVCFTSLFLFSCSNTEKCLEKAGYKNCDGLKNAFNLQNSDEAQKYHDIKTKCGCKD